MSQPSLPAPAPGQGDSAAGGAATGVRIHYDPALPIAAHAEEIRDLIAAHQVVVVAGETGSGKTTQLPKMCLELGRRSIAHTQPRRIAARSVAERLAEELEVPLGDVVGYQVRFTRRTSRDTRIKVMTDGVLLAEISHDRDLRRYDTIIIDEAHERSLNIDFLLGYLKQLLDRRPELKVIVTSATIDTARFSAHFDDAPIIEVSGRTYPVEIRYRPLAGDGDDGEVPASGEAVDQVEGICRAVAELPPSGDILVFLSGEREIRDAAEGLAAMDLRDTEILPLFARLSAAEQHRVFTPHPGRRIVLATNVAETSLTVPGIRYVVDPGTARISRYSARTKVQRLPIEPVSQASANQRAGRCGRVAPGICIRLYSQEDFEARPEFTEPEILRTNLASVILQMAEARLGDIADFPFVEPPDRTQIGDGLRLLDELGALQPGHRHRPRLTPVGHQLARVPLDPRLARMIVEAGRLGSLREVLVIVAALAIPDVRERPAEQRDRADALHRRFWTEGGLSTQGSTDADGAPLRYTVHTGRRDQQQERPDAGGDVLAIVRLWTYLTERRKALSGNAFRRLCRDEFLNFLRIREWQDLHTQLRDIAKDLGLERNQSPAPDAAVLTAVLSGLLSHIGLLQEREETTDPRARRRGGRGPREYLGARGTHFAIQPGSALAGSPPELVMAVELVETSRLWARTVAGIRSEWVEQVGGHAISSHVSEPHWSATSGSVMAYERVSIYGVPIIAQRTVNYARLHPEEARAIFIRSALVEGQWRTRHHFFHQNQRVLKEAEELEERQRRRDLVVDDAAIYAFYDARIPADVVSVAHFDAWWRRHPDKRLLEMSLDDLIVDDAAVDADAFPDHWQVAGLDLPITYVFDPGSGHDGVTVDVDIAQLNQLDPAPFTWQVPGLRHELATELIRGLPKQVRVRFVPAPDVAARALDWLDRHDADHSVPFVRELGRALRQLTGEVVDAGQWRPDAVPDHLRVSFRVLEKGRPTGAGKDLATLQQDLRDRVTRTLTRASRTQDTLTGTSWVFGTIPATLTVQSNGVRAVGYPALVDRVTAVALETLDSPARQARFHAAGVRRLLTLTNPDPTRWVVSHLGNADKLALGTSPYPSVPELLADARLKTVDRLARRFGDPGTVRDQAGYESLALAVREAQADEMRAVVATAASVLRGRREVEALLTPANPAAPDVTEQLANLVFRNFISATADPWYDHLPRYLQAMAQRLRAAASNPTRDRQQVQVVEDLEAEYAALCDRQPPGPLPAPVEEIGFLIEELRVQLFAQQLRTVVTVSPKRIRAAIAAQG
ncbi:MAG TPA: ATP-dependent RNA helicase HrpA [Propionibacteriaceae bacterium]|nr:ATP-dependent RNA helicase HrpA [Propionibacteriaceae bacterium]